MGDLQTFGVQPSDVAERIAGLGISAGFIGPTPAGIVAQIRAAAARVCGHMQGQGIPIPTAEAQNEIIWQNARGAVIVDAASRVLSSRNAGGTPQLIGRLRGECNEFLELVITAAPRTGQESESPGPHQAIFVSTEPEHTSFARRFSRNVGGGL